MNNQEREVVRNTVPPVARPAASAEPYDAEARCRAYYNSDLRPYIADDMPYARWQAVWMAAQFDAAARPDSSKTRVHPAVAQPAARVKFNPTKDSPFTAMQMAAVIAKRDGKLVKVPSDEELREAIRDYGDVRIGSYIGESSCESVKAAWNKIDFLLARHGQPAQPAASAEPVQITDSMALAFHRALTDGAIDQGEVNEIKVGLTAALSYLPAPVAAKPSAPNQTRIDQIAGAISKHISTSLIQREVIAAAQYITHKYATPADAQAQQDADDLNLDRLADYVADYWPDKKYKLEEIVTRLKATWPASFMPSQRDADKVDAQPNLNLPERRNTPMRADEGTAPLEFDNGWNCCLEAVEKMNAATQPAPAMAGEDFSDDEIKTLSYTFNKIEGHPSHFHAVFDCVGFARALLKRIQPASAEDAKDAARYRWLRRGQHWSVIDGIGDTLRADALDATIDAMQQGGQS